MKSRSRESKGDEKVCSWGKGLGYYLRANIFDAKEMLKAIKEERLPSPTPAEEGPCLDCVAMDFTANCADGGVSPHPPPSP